MNDLIPQNENVRIYTNPNTGKEEMYVSEKLIPEEVKKKAMIVVGAADGYLYMKSAAWNYFSNDNRDELRSLVG